MKKKVNTSTTANGFLIDEVSDKKIRAKVGFDGGKIYIDIEGYGDCSSEKGFGQPVVIDYFDDKLKVVIWGDINDEDPTAHIDLAGAKEDRRKVLTHT